MKTCSVDLCEKGVQAKGLCSTHYWQMRTYGKPNFETPLKRVKRLIDEARLRGDKHYFTGLPCSRGHIDKRNFHGHCSACIREKSREVYARHPEKVKALIGAWREKNADRHRAMIKDWESRNQDRKNEHRARRRAVEKNAMPQWANRREIANIYSQARKLGMVVDHIIPLQSKFVCGLHVHNNMQLLPAIENKRKANKFSSDFEQVGQVMT